MNLSDADQRRRGIVADWIDPRRTVVALVDMQVDFASPAGALGRAGAQLDAVPSALAAASRLASAARASGATVVFIALQTHPETDSVAWAERLRRSGGHAADIALCRAGTPGAAFYGPTPELGDLVIAKTRYSGFFQTPLDAALRARGVDTLIVGGLTTECCVESTVRDAFHLDYHVLLAADACAGYDADLHAAALKSLALNFAILVSSDEIAAAWGGRNAPPA